MTPVWTDEALARAVASAAVKSGVMNVNLDQFSPGNASVNGREETAALIKTLHRGGPQNLVKEHYRAADARGDILRKGDKPLSTAWDAIKAIHSRGRRRMVKGIGLPPQDSGGWTVADPARVGAVSPHADPSAEFAGAPVKPTLGSPPHSASIRVGRPPPQDADVTVAAIKAVHAAGGRPLWG